MKARQLKQKFVTFFADKNHRQIPSASLIPENDSTTLFISAGIQPLTPYFLGKKHPFGSRLSNVQKCVRTGDIEEVGDTYHHTFFEMLGNWSLGDYFKEEMIPWSFEFLTKYLKINPDHLHVTCFAGDQDSPKDNQTAKLWQQLGIPSKRIHFLGKKDNWWGPSGSIGPCGPDTEMFVDISPASSAIDFTKGCQKGRFVEIWNDVFIQHYQNKDNQLEKLVQNNIDTGMGVERTIAIISGFKDNYLTDIWQPIIQKIEQVSGKSYQNKDYQKSIRIIADHIRSTVFIIADGVETGNKEAGYVLRRLIRRAIVQAKNLNIDNHFTALIGQSVIDNQKNYAGDYPELNNNKDKILTTLEMEEKKFRNTLDRGLKKINQLIESKKLSGKNAFNLYQSFGFPLELIQEEAKKQKYKLKSNFVRQFNQAKQSHAQLSKTLSTGKFKSGLADDSAIITKYHTATHLLHAALRQILGDHVHQAGSNITAKRLRFDFTHPQKLSPSQIKKIQKLVNQKIQSALPVKSQDMPLGKAKKQSTSFLSSVKYPSIVSLYSIGDFSTEICAGPHVTNTKKLSLLKITKQESSGSGKRRLYAVFQ